MYNDTLDSELIEEKYSCIGRKIQKDYYDTFASMVTTKYLMYNCGVFTKGVHSIIYKNVII